MNVTKKNEKKMRLFRANSGEIMRKRESGGEMMIAAELYGARARAGVMKEKIYRARETRRRTLIHPTWELTARENLFPLHTDAKRKRIAPNYSSFTLGLCAKELRQIISP